MKLIDLLNKIANGEELPKEIRYKGDYWYLEQKFSNELPYYKNGYDNDNLLKNEEEFYFSKSLNHEVEIIEEKKIPEKIKDKYCSQISKVELAQKYNEIIDYLKSKGE